MTSEHDDLLEDGPVEDRPMSLGEHLEELRRRLIRGVIWLTLGTIVAYAFSTELLAIIAHALKAALESGEVVRGKIVATEVGTTFFTALKASVVAGLFLSGPFVLGELWRFVSPGLYPKERRWIVYSAPLSYALFAVGGAFFYFVVQPVMLRFFLDYGHERQDLIFNSDLPVEQMIDIGRWFTLWLGMALIMGMIFQLPLLMVGAQLTGLVDARTFSAYRRHFIVGSVIAAAFLTPTGDALTLAMTMVPILILFEVGLLLCRMLGGGRNKESPE